MTPSMGKLETVVTVDSAKRQAGAEDLTPPQ
jgi:hypothetical protein